MNASIKKYPVLATCPTANGEIRVTDPASMWCISAVAILLGTGLAAVLGVGRLVHCRRRRAAMKN